MFGLFAASIFYNPWGKGNNANVIQRLFFDL
jgi:hypothetical protein